MKNNYIKTVTLLITFFLSSSITQTAYCKIWQVGATRTYKVPSAVSGLVSNGDTVQIDAGAYTDCTSWTKNNLLLQGVGNGYAHCMNSVCGEKGVWNINASANNITIENMEFSGASITGAEGGNGAGLRAQGGSYTIINCYFHDNQDGILCNPTAGNDSADVLIEYSVFADNGCPTNDPSGCDPGYEHNMYIGSGYRSFTLMYCYSHGAINGHNVKTRASNNYILYNSIMDLATGTSSYDIDIAQGGPTIIMGNLVEGGPMKVNHSIICYNEGSTNAPPQNLFLINNTVVNDQTTGDFLLMPLTTNDTLTMINNIFAGPGGQFYNNAPNFSVIDSTHNWWSKTVAAAGLVNAAGYNYNLTGTSPAIDKGTNAGYADWIAPYPHFSLTPAAEYVDSANTEVRTTGGTAIDLGAYEFPVATGIASSATGNFMVRVLQNPVANKLIIQVINPVMNEDATIRIYDMTGRLVTQQLVQGSNELLLNITNLAQGVYIARTETAGGFCTNKFVIAR